MSLIALWSGSMPGRLARGFSRAIEHSALVNWYLGSDAFHERVAFNNSRTARILGFAGQGLGFLIKGVGKALRFLLEPTASYQTVTQFYDIFPKQPVRFFSLLGLSTLFANSAVLLFANPHWSVRSLVLRGSLAIVLVLGLTVRISWQQLGSSSLIVRLTKDFVWGD